MSNAIFQDNLQAFIFIGLISIALYIVIFIIKIILERAEKIPVSRKNKINFGIRLVAIVYVVYLIVEGFPSFSEIPPEISAIITGSISTALAFATSGIFSNFVAGVLLWIIDPIDIGDVVKIKKFKGIIRSISLTKVVLETFDRILVEFANSEIVSSIVLNYTIKLTTRKKFYNFKKQVRAPQDIGNSRLDIDLYDNEIRKLEEEELKEVFSIISEDKKDRIHSFTFTMRIPFNGFRVKVEYLSQICIKYKEKFGFTPHFHIIGFSNEIEVKFRILTLDSNNLLNFQPDFAKELYQKILK